MKKHILSTVSQKIESPVNNSLYYDTKTQMSYLDNTLSKKAIGLSSGRTIETREIETSDEDYFNVQGRSTKTFATEISDPDEITLIGCLGRTMLTETVEESDPDEFSIQ